MGSVSSIVTRAWAWARARLRGRRLSALCAGAGLLLVVGYWFSVRPVSGYPGYATGYSEDLCMTDFTRQLAAEQISRYGKPWFKMDQVMAPQGASVPYMSWQPERDWLGGLFWRWNPDFPFAWAFAGFSWIVSFLLVGFILGKMGRILRFGASAAWLMATAVVLFHVPRHFKIWHHWEHLMQHWVYLGLFLDAWLWARFQREKEWDRRIEIWRAFAGVGMLQGVGTFWGPLILEWMLVRGFLLGLWAVRRRRGEKTTLSPLRGGAISVPIVLGCALFALDLRWYLPLLSEVRKFGQVVQPAGWFANFLFFIRPLWLTPLLSLAGIHRFFGTVLRPIDNPETVVTVGWFYWIPALLGLNALRKKRGGPGWIAVAPFMVLLVTAVLYASINEPTHFFQRALQLVIPFMTYCRVCSRWGLFLPQILGILIVLSWPELSAGWWARIRGIGSARWKALAAVFCALSCVEFSWILTPVNMMPAIPPSLRSMLVGIRRSPGTTVLDLPFCVAGGNGVCTEQECPQYPSSTISECLRIWHRKKVYGLYQSRMTEADCAIYRKSPYENWFSAWRAERCFSGPEWDGFCAYLGAHHELSAVLLYADIWKGGGTPGCLAQFDAHLGKPLGEAVAFANPTRGGKGSGPTRIFRYPARCVGDGP